MPPWRRWTPVACGRAPSHPQGGFIMAFAVVLTRLTFLSLIVTLIVFMASCASGSGPSPATSESRQPTSTAPVPTKNDALTELTTCERVLAKKSMLWGQSPGVIHSGNPSITGRLQPGDYVQILTPKNAGGAVRVLVYPHDNRTVGNSGNKVWIDWASLELTDSEYWMFECEG